MYINRLLRDLKKTRKIIWKKNQIYKDYINIIVHLSFSYSTGL